MIETLKNIIDSSYFDLLFTPNIKVIEKKLSNEVIKFPNKFIADRIFDSSTFKNSQLINMKFINGNLNSSFFENCLVQNCMFENTILKVVEFDNCVFKNCRFIN